MAPETGPGSGPGPGPGSGSGRGDAEQPSPFIDLWHVDRVIHEPMRLAVMNILCSGYQADHSFLKAALGATDGNLASHLRALESAGYVQVTKRFLGRKPNTLYAATPAGRKAYGEYSRVIARMLERGKQPTPSASDPLSEDPTKTDNG
jgi:DNA-binding transcriptional ArsR family regulator